MHSHRLSIRSLRVLGLGLIVALLLAQWGTIEHSVEHPFHKESKLCQLFIAFEHSAPLSVTIAALLLVAATVCFSTLPVRRLAASPLYTAPIRGPPVLLV